MPVHLRRPRATVISCSALLAAAITGTLVVTGCNVLGGGTVDTVGMVDFTRPLAIPQLAASTIDTDGRRVFELTAQDGSSEFVAGNSTPTRGFDGDYLAPTLRAAAGEEVVVNVRNELDESTSVHWHGMHLPAAMDGGPHQIVGPGATWSPTWMVDQRAATLWYHPHVHGETERQVAEGLAGMFIVTDSEEAALALPREYGVDDIPVTVQDVRFAEDGTLRTDVRGAIGRLGDRLLVNGTVDPFFDVTTSLVRVRLLNASTARVYDFGFDDAREFTMIASDGGLLTEPLALDSIQLSPGERAEILVSMVPGETAILRSTPPDLGVSSVTAGMNSGNDRFDVLELRAVPELAASAPVPSKLADFERTDDSAVDHERRFELDGTNINGMQMDPSRIDQVVEVGDTEAWTVVNTVGTPHSFHVHDVQFQIASIDGLEPKPELLGWKDTVFLRSDVEYRLVMRFEGYTDPDRPYMFHCHLLWHEDRGMMGQFVVVEPGDDAGTPPPITYGSHDGPGDTGTEEAGSEHH